MAPNVASSKPPEEQLLQAARCGDSRAFDKLVTRYQEYVYRLMLRACHHPQDAEEVAMEAFARAYQQLAQFEGRSSFISWLGRIATNLCLKRRNRPAPQSVSLEQAGGTQEGLWEAPEPTPEEQALRDELKCKVQSAIANLPESEAAVLRLRDIEGWPAQEVADRLGLTVPAVKARLHRARARLRERLNSYFLEAEEAPQAVTASARAEWRASEP